MVTKILQSVNEVLNEDPEMKKEVPFTLAARGSKGQRSYQAILRYTGPDNETIFELQIQAPFWMQNPELFWRGQNRSNFSHLNPQAQIVGLYLSQRLSDA